MEQRSATYHRAAAARARRLRAEATTPWLKEHLENWIAQHEQIAAEIERASDITCPHGAICVVMQGTANSLGWAEHLAREAGDGWFACDVPVLPDIPEPYSVCIRYFECSQPQRSQ